MQNAQKLPIGHPRLLLERATHVLERTTWSETYYLLHSRLLKRALFLLEWATGWTPLCLLFSCYLIWATFTPCLLRQGLASSLKSLHALIKASLALFNASYMLHIDHLSPYALTQTSTHHNSTHSYILLFQSTRQDMFDYLIKSSSSLTVLVLASTPINLPKLYFCMSYDPPPLLFI